MGKKPKKLYTTKNGKKVITKLHYTMTHAWTYRAMRLITKPLIRLKPEDNLRSKPSPLKNMVAQVHNMIRLYGNHTAEELHTWNLEYRKLVKIFKSHLVQPNWHQRLCSNYQ